MIIYMVLGAWCLTLIALGFVVVSTGLPDDNGNSGDEIFLVWCLKIAYLVVLVVTVYKMGAHFSSL